MGRGLSVSELANPFEVADVEAELALSLRADERSASTLEIWFGRGLLLLTLVAVLICDLQIVHDAPNYYPDNEAYRVAVVQYIADHGTPPVLGTDSFIVDPTVPVPPNTTVLHRIIAGQSPTITANTPYPQVLAVDPPYPYYVAVPVTWIVPWNHRILALRVFSVLLACAAIVFLWAAVREAWPANPIAAGLAGVVLGTMSGLVEAFTAYQPTALMFASWCAGLWLVVRDLKRRRCSAWTVATVTAATCASPVALPAAVAAVVVLTLRAAGTRGRLLGIRLAVVLAPTVVWVIWNLHAYGDPWPLNVSSVAGETARSRNWHALTAVIAPVSTVSESVFDQLYSSGGSPYRVGNQRPEAFVAIAFAIALSWSLWSGRIAQARLALARFGTLMLASLLSIFSMTFIASVVAVAPMSYPEFLFGGYAAAWAGVAGIGLSTPLVGHRRLLIAAATLVTLVLVTIMVRAPAL